VTQNVRSDAAKPSVVAAGYSTVDVLHTDRFRVAPGGTAINVTRALESLSWDAEFIGTVGRDPGGDFVRRQLKAAGVDVTRLYQDERWTTPVIVQEMQGSDHSWRFRCPVCAASFAKHRPTSPNRVEQIVTARTAPDVFFFDRASLFTIGLAQAWGSAGSYVVFEPAGLGRPQLFERAVGVADLIKFSSERAAAFRDRLPVSGVLVVETMGVHGTRFRLPRGTAWHRLPANLIASPVDYVGAGDWTTAGLLNSLLGDNPSSVTLETVLRAVRAGQRLGALACTWEGVHPGALKPLPGGSFESFACPRHIAEMKSRMA